MFLSSLATLSFALSAVASPFLGSNGGLAIELGVENAKVKSVDDLLVKATVTNEGNKEVRILKFGTVLDELPTRSFSVTKGDKEVTFKGIHISIDIDQVDEHGYVVIPPGKSVSVSHKVAELYDFETAGAGAFKFTSVAEFPIAQHYEDKNVPTTLEAYEAPPSSVEVEITTNVKSSHHTKRAVMGCHNPEMAAFIKASYYEAKELARMASQFATEYATSTLYKAYFKTIRGSDVAGIYNTVIAENSRERTLGCVDEVGGCEKGVIAYAFVAPPQNIVLCPIFFNEKPLQALCAGTSVNARNVRAGTMLHELTHAVGDTDDINYGCPTNQQLASAQQFKNADNYNCFATAVYVDIYCPAA